MYRTLPSTADDMEEICEIRFLTERSLYQMKALKSNV